MSMGGIIQICKNMYVTQIVKLLCIYLVSLSFVNVYVMGNIKY